MKTATLCLVVLVVAAAVTVTVNAGLEEDFFKLEKGVQDKLVSKVKKAYGSLSDLAGNMKDLIKTFPEDFKTAKAKLEKFIDNVEDLASDAKDLYEDKKKGKTFSLGLKMIETGVKFSEVESELKSVKPMLKKMIQEHLTGAKSAISELTDFIDSIKHYIERRSLSNDLLKVTDLFSKGGILKKITNAYAEVTSAVDKVKKLAKQFPEVYRNVKTEIPDVEKSLKSLYRDIVAIAKDKKDGDTIMMMIKVASAGEKLTHLVGIVNKIKPELENLLHETTGPAKTAVKEVEKLLHLVH